VSNQFLELAPGNAGQKREDEGLAAFTELM